MFPNATDGFRKTGSANASPPISRYGPRLTDHENEWLVMCPANKLVEFAFGECGDTLAVSPECCIESLFRLVVEIVSPTKDGILGNLRMIHTDDSNRTVRTCGPSGADSILIGPPDTITALSLQFGVERIKELYPFGMNRSAYASTGHYSSIDLSGSVPGRRAVVRLETRPCF